MSNLNLSKALISARSPQVSIGMPVYNGAKFIREALDSLLAQTFTDFELIISDNASTDDTEAICWEYSKKDDRIRYVRQPSNRGVLDNFKFLLDNAIGEYFMWAAADDVWDKNWIKMLLPVAVDSQCLAYGTLQTIDGNSNNMKHAANNRKFRFTGYKFIRRLKYFIEPSLLGKANPIYGIYPKRFITEKVFNVLNNKNATDMLFLYQLLADIEIKGGIEVFLYKRIHDDCMGGGVEMQSTKKKNLMVSIIKLPLQISNYQYRQIVGYGILSNIYERTAQILLTPIILIMNLYCVVVNNPRFRRTLTDAVP